MAGLNRILILCIHIIVSQQLTAKVIFVNINAEGANNGTNWNDAYKDFQSALDNAINSDTIWVAQGTYLPTKDMAGSGSPSDNRSKTFRIPSKDIKIFGGFKGDENSLQQRVLKVYETILSGDLDENDKKDCFGHILSADSLVGNNAYHVVYLDVQTNQFKLDGFTITGGMATGTADSTGAGILHIVSGYNGVSEPIISNCSFKSNYAVIGGALMNLTMGSGDTSRLSLVNCFIAANRALRFGGGVQNQANGGSVNMNINHNCIYVENVAGREGGGANNEASGVSGTLNHSTYVNCTFTLNAIAFSPFASGQGIGFGQLNGSPDDGLSASMNVKTSIENSIIYLNQFGDIDTTKIDGGFDINYSYVRTPNMLSSGTGNLDGNQFLFSPFPNYVQTDNIPLCGYDGRVTSFSQTNGKGDTMRIAKDIADLDGDGNISEEVPYDVYCNPRRSQDTLVDLGAYQTSGVAVGISLPENPSNTSFVLNSLCKADSASGTFLKNIAECESFDLEFSILNFSSGKLVLPEDGLTLTGSSDFSIGLSPLEITSNNVSAALFSITLTPSSPGIKQCTITVKTNDLLNPEIKFFYMVEVDASTPKRIFVDGSANAGMNNGTSWADAYTSLDSALLKATACDTLWVAKGLYIPTFDLGGNLDTTNSRNKTFNIDKSLKIYGGFNGDETMLAERDFKIYKTILSGDIDSNDINVDGNFIAENPFDIQGQNAYGVFSSSTIRGFTLDGFTITSGDANVISDTTNSSGGGGSISLGSIVNCEFIGNKAKEYGGGLAVSRGPVRVENCLFRGNLCDSIGGGMIIGLADNVTITNCAFQQNAAISVGGLWVGGSNAELINSTFSGNMSTDSLGVVYSDSLSVSGEATINKSSHLDVYNTIVYNNKDTTGKVLTIQGEENTTLTINHSLVEGSTVTGVGNIPGNTNPNFVMDFDSLSFPEIFDDTGNLCLMNTSPVLNVGNSMKNTTLKDLKCMDRIFGPTIDFGAYELQEAPANCALNDVTVVASPAMDVTIQAIQNLETSGNISIDHNVTFQAGQSIRFNPEFIVNPNFQFIAQILDCTLSQGILQTEKK